MRVAVVDLGSNSTRLLIADVDGAQVSEVVRDSAVTRLGEGVEATGMLSPEAIDRVFAVLARYRREIDRHGAEAVVGVLTSAVRDAADGERFARAVRERFGIAARTISGEQEARLTYAGATSERADDVAVSVIDIGGGSTELVVGERGEVLFHASTQVGVVRHSERHLPSDPPTGAQLAALRADAGAAFAAVLRARPRLRPRRAIAVAGTATQAAAIAGRRDLDRELLEDMLRRLAALPLARRREVAGLDPARAGTIVAGLAILLEALTALGLDAAVASEHDLLRGAALHCTAFVPSPPHLSG